MLIMDKILILGDLERVYWSGWYNYKLRLGLASSIFDSVDL